jgi:predicted ester cyclase
MKQLLLGLAGLFLLAISCQQTETSPKMTSATSQPSPDSLRAFLREYIADVWGGHDFDLAQQKYWHPEVYNVNAPEIAHGPEGIKMQVDAFLAGFPDGSIEFEDAIAEGNIIAARIWLTGTHEGEFGGVKPTGKPIRIREYVFLEMKDGKIWKMHPLVDYATLMGQIKAE